jgi:hypothetical protein
MSDRAQLRELGASSINGPAGPVDMRDVRRLQEELGEQAAEAARQTLAAHKASLKRIDEVHTRLDALDERLRAVDANQRTMLGLLHRLAEVPGPARVSATPEETSPLVARLTSLFGMSPATTRLMLAATIASVFASVLTACSLTVAHAATSEQHGAPRVEGVFP